MPVFRLAHDLVFPDPELADPDGLLAVGGDLSVDRLLLAYRLGIFPWYDQPPVLWWSPDPRLVLDPDDLKISRSLRSTIRKQTFEVRVDTAFREVARACASVKRSHEDGTWITSDVIDAYSALHDRGYAHSIESWSEGQLVGGLYGVCLGRCFFGESMFSLRPDASKVALVRLVEILKQRNIDVIDCQVTTEHLLSLGAREVPRSDFLRQIAARVRDPVNRGPWTQPTDTGGT
jgi:leucyl/phenylalanyl-tRNA--protein transferase